MLIIFIFVQASRRPLSRVGRPGIYYLLKAVVMMLWVYWQCVSLLTMWKILIWTCFLQYLKIKNLVVNTWWRWSEPADIVTDFEMDLFPRWKTSRPGLARCRGGWSTCRRRFRSTTPRRRNYVSSPIIWTSWFEKNCTFRLPTSLTSLPIIQQLMVIYVGIVTGQ